MIQQDDANCSVSKAYPYEDAAPSPKVIIALLPEPETVVPCLDCALAVAAGFNITILAIHVGFNPNSALVAPEELAIQQLRELNEGTASERLARTRAAYDTWVSTAGSSIPISWKDNEGDVGEIVSAETGNADLVVMGNPMRLDGRDALYSTLFRSKRLVLLAPPALKLRPQSPSHIIGRHIVVGWKPGEPVRRAVRQAGPWLAKAEKVTVVSLEKPNSTSYETSARSFFADLDIAVNCIGLQRDDTRVGYQLLASAERLGADSLLIGAFKHGALWEAILGGVTRDVLATARLPVFMMC